MADPLSITAGVLGLLSICVKVGSALKDFYDGANIADAKVKGLLTDVESFTLVLRLMKDTFGQERIQTSFQATGHIGNHWNNLSISINDGRNTLLRLQKTLEKVNKSVSVLDGTRKHLRLKGASEEIGIFQLQVRSYRDTLQLSLQTVILWNQVTFQESTDKILPNLEELNQSIRRIALDINDRMSSLQNVVESNASGTQLLALSNLRNCVQSAASIVSSTSTTLGMEHAEGILVTDGSEFGDCFPSEPGETMLRWISSNTVYDFEEENAAESSSKRRNLVSGDLQSVEESAGSEQSDSDTDLEVEKFQALMKQGKKKFREKDFGSAERLFRNCLARISSNKSKTPLHHIPISEDEIMEFLLSVYLAQEKWDEAQSLLLEKISVESRDYSRDSGGVLTDLLTLVDVLVYKNSYAEALLYGIRALKGYRKMGSNGVPGVESSLKALIRVCHMDANYDEEDAYAAILSDFLLLTTSEMNSPDATQSDAERPSSSTRAPNSPVGGQQLNHHPKKRQTNISDAEQPLNKAIQEDITPAQKSGKLELLEDDATYLPSEHGSDPLANVSPLQFTSTEEITSEAASTSVAEHSIWPKLHRKFINDPPSMSLTSDLAFASLTSALDLSSNQPTSSIVPSDSSAISLGHSRSKSVGLVAIRNENEEYDPFRNFVSSTSTQATHSTILLLPKAASSTKSLQSIPDTLEIPVRVNVPAQPVEAPAMLEVELSSIDNHIEPPKDQLKIDLSSISHHEITAIVKKGQVIEVTGDRDGRDLVTVFSPHPLKSTSGRAEICRKIVLVGDGPCGRSALIHVFLTRTFPWYGGVTWVDNYVADVTVDGERVELGLWDLGGGEDFDRLRAHWYPDTHVILMCFAIDDPDSLDNVQEKWISEVQHFCPGVPIILVGLRKDLRKDPKTIEDLRRTSQNPVTYEEGEEVRKKIEAYKYLECSAMTNEGVSEVFEEAARVSLLVKVKGKKNGKKTEENTGAIRRLFSRSGILRL